jgi:hypothetical protein
MRICRPPTSTGRLHSAHSTRRHEPANIEPSAWPTGPPLPSPLCTNSLLSTSTPPSRRPQRYRRSKPPMGPATRARLPRSLSELLNTPYSNQPYLNSTRSSCTRACERICQPNVVQRLRRHGTLRDGVEEFHYLNCVFENYVATCNSHRPAHNPASMVRRAPALLPRATRRRIPPGQRQLARIDVIALHAIERSDGKPSGCSTIDRRQDDLRVPDRARLSALGRRRLSRPHGDALSPRLRARARQKLAACRR